MTWPVVNGVATVGSVIGAVAVLWQFAQKRAKPRTRSATFAGTLVLLVVAGVGISGTVSQNRVVASAIDESRSLPVATTSTTAPTETIAPPAPEPRSEARTEPAAVPRPTKHYIDLEQRDPNRGVLVTIVDEQGQRQPQLAAGANEALAAQGLHAIDALRDEAFADRIPERLALGSRELFDELRIPSLCRAVVIGIVSRRAATEADATLEGLVTARVHLRFVVLDGASGNITHSFETEVRGGGFTLNSAND